MSMKDFTDITFVLDRSGSMATIADDVVGGYKTFINEQKAVGENASISLMQFDTIFEKVFAGVPILNASDQLSFHPRGGTALLDAIGQTINEVGARLRALKEFDRPDKVVIVIVTDGEENSSNWFTLDAVRRMVENQTNNYNWKFVFLGANIDSFTVGGHLSIGAYNTTNYVPTKEGVSNMMRGVSVYMTSTRQSSDGCSAYSLTSCVEQAAQNALAQDAASSGTISGNTTSAVVLSK
jgi:hypothetical protein